VAVWRREQGLDIALEMGVGVWLERLPGGSGIWVWEKVFRLRTEDYPRQWKMGPHAQGCDCACRGFREASDAVCSWFGSGPDLRGCDRSVSTCASVKFFLRRENTAVEILMVGTIFQKKCMERWAVDWRRNTRNTLVTSGEWEEKETLRQAQREFFIRKSAKIIRSEPPDKRFYKRLVNATNNRVYRGNENWRRPLDSTLKGCSEFSFSDFGGGWCGS